ncbi:MAG: serine hydrolase domain-containing protein [Myxococcota bacterium]
MTESAEIHGHCDPSFARVRDAFAGAFESSAEVGAACSVQVDGEAVVDLWAGWQDASRTRPWERDTLVNVFSTTKGMTALCAHLLIDEGRLDLDAPVAAYWPEFAAADKGAISFRQLISHQAGLPALRDPLPTEALFDWQTMTQALAAETPWWKPGTRHGYHAVTFGWLVGEVVRRISGQSLGAFFRERVAGPLGADFYIGFGPELDSRVADLIQGPVHADDGASFFEEILKDPESMAARAFMNPPVMGDVSSSRAWRGAEIPAANGHATAAALAQVYGQLACGKLLSREGIERAREEQAAGPDAILPLETRIANGFMLAPQSEPCGPNPRAFNHGGAGGSLGFCDPETRLGFGYVMNHMHMGAWLIDPRARDLVGAVYESL